MVQVPPSWECHASVTPATSEFSGATGAGSSASRCGRGRHGELWSVGYRLLRASHRIIRRQDFVSSGQNSPPPRPGVPLEAGPGVKRGKVQAAPPALTSAPADTRWGPSAFQRKQDWHSAPCGKPAAPASRWVPLWARARLGSRKIRPDGEPWSLQGEAWSLQTRSLDAAFATVGGRPAAREKGRARDGPSSAGGDGVVTVSVLVENKAQGPPWYSFLKASLGSDGSTERSPPPSPSPECPPGSGR